jgi:hypothetical protein
MTILVVGLLFVLCLVGILVVACWEDSSIKERTLKILNKIMLFFKKRIINSYKCFLHFFISKDELRLIKEIENIKNTPLNLVKFKNKTRQECLKQENYTLNA